MQRAIYGILLSMFAIGNVLGASSYNTSIKVLTIGSGETYTIENKKNIEVSSIVWEGAINQAGTIEKQEGSAVFCKPFVK